VFGQRQPPSERTDAMGNDKKKKAASGSKAAKPQSDYKANESEGKASKSDSKFQKAIGKAKDASRKG